jgi:1,4-alpha-glucan branching enzyme
MLLFQSTAGCGAKRLGPEARPGGVHFSFSAPAAKHVSLAGSFNQWDADADPLAGPDSNGIWSIILPLPAGRYEYLLSVDREWKLDPETPSVDDGFGGRNSVVVIGK